MERRSAPSEAAEGSAGFPDPASSDFALRLELTESEHSRDSHSNSYEIVVDDRELHYRGPFGRGTRGRYATEEHHLTLTEAQRDDLMERLRRDDLFRSIEENAPTQGALHSVDATARVTIDGRTERIRISGPTRMHRTAEGSPLEHTEVAASLERVATQVKRMVEAAAEGS